MSKVAYWFAQFYCPGKAERLVEKARDAELSMMGMTDSSGDRGTLKKTSCAILSMRVSPAHWSVGV